MIEEQARPVLNDKELSSLKYYISEYIQGEINVDGLVIALFHLLDSSVKVGRLRRLLLYNVDQKEIKLFRIDYTENTLKSRL